MTFQNMHFHISFNLVLDINLALVFYLMGRRKILLDCSTTFLVRWNPSYT